MISPYQQNIDIIKGFFKKPIVLVLAIASFTCIAYNLVASFLNIYGNIGDQAIKYFLDHLPEQVKIPNNLISTSGSSGGGVDIIGILFAVSFLLFFLLSKKQENKLGVPSVMFKVISIVSVVGIGIVTGIVLPVFAIIAVSAPMINEVFDGMGTFMFYLYMYLGIYLAVFLVYVISQLVFSLSIRKSLTSIYLKRTGAMFFGVMSFIQASAGIAASIFVVAGLSNSEAITLNSTQIIVLIVSSVLSAAQNVLTGIVAIQYSNYIKDISQKFRTEYVPETSALPPMPYPETPVQQFPTEDIPVQPAPVQQAPVAPEFAQQNMQEQNPFEHAQAPEQNFQPPYQPQTAPIEPPQAPYQPQSAPVEPPQAPAPNQIPYGQPIPVQPPAQQAPADLETPRFCTQCGKPVGPDDYFCNNCGTKIIRN